MANEFPVIEIATPRGEKSEPMGTKPKFWIKLNNGRWLFKYNRPEHGEDWSEKIAAEVAGLLGIDCAVVDLATCEGKQGVVSRNFVEDVAAGERLVHGNELLNDFYGGTYPTNEAYKVNQHCIPAIRSVLNEYCVSSTAPGCVPGVTRTFWHLFAGYLMLDALIGNTDRHHENWGIIVPAIELPTTLDVIYMQGRRLRLAPSFDHASSLGRELNDVARANMLQAAGNRSVSRYAQKARSKIYLDQSAAKPLSPLAAFDAATADMPAVRSFWLNRLLELEPDQFARIAKRVPSGRMSAEAKRFAQELLEYNRKKLLGLNSDGPL